MFDWIKKAFGDSEPERRRRREPEPEPEFRPAKLPPRRDEQTPPPPASGLRAVPGALVSQDRHSGQVTYNLLTPHMKQFMGRCIGAIKKAGLPAKGTGQFSVLVGEPGIEIHLSEFYQPSDDPLLVEHVVSEARRLHPMDKSEHKRLKQLGKELAEHRSRAVHAELANENPWPVGSPEWIARYKELHAKGSPNAAQNKVVDEGFFRLVLPGLWGSLFDGERWTYSSSNEQLTVSVMSFQTTV